MNSRCASGGFARPRHGTSSPPTAREPDPGGDPQRFAGLVEVHLLALGTRSPDQHLMCRDLRDRGLVAPVPASATGRWGFGRPCERCSRPPRSSAAGCIEPPTASTPLPKPALRCQGEDCCHLQRPHPHRRPRRGQGLCRYRRAAFPRAAAKINRKVSTSCWPSPTSPSATGSICAPRIPSSRPSPRCASGPGSTRGAGSRRRPTRPRDPSPRRVQRPGWEQVDYRHGRGRHSAGSRCASRRSAGLDGSRAAASCPTPPRRTIDPDPVVDLGLAT